MVTLGKDSALLIIDMINDFVKPDGKLYVQGVENIIPKISEIISLARAASRPVIYVCDSHSQDDDEFERWGPHAIEGTPGSMIAEELKPSAEDLVIPKRRFSAFYDTRLEEHLNELGIKHVVITGTVTNICVFISALDALMRGYRVTVVKDAVWGIDKEDHEYALRQLEKVFGIEVL